MKSAFFDFPLRASPDGGKRAGLGLIFWLDAQILQRLVKFVLSFRFSRNLAGEGPK
jgi:hypothetical protein